MPGQWVSAHKKEADLSAQSIHDPFTSKYSKVMQQFDVLS